MAHDRPLNPGEWSLLALLCERPAHGWALAAELSRDGEIGAIWSVKRPLVYRALELLEARGLVEQAGEASSPRGPHRTIHRPTRRGRAAVRRWLAEPVAHIRDIRPDLLLKLVFSDRVGVSPRALLDAQLVVVDELAQALDRQLADTGGARALVLRYRVETAAAARRFIEEARRSAS